jgi:hypothetical protein
MKNVFRLIGWLFLAQFFTLGISLTPNSRDLEYKVALCLFLLLSGLFIIIKTKDETSNRT